MAGAPAKPREKVGAIRPQGQEGWQLETNLGAVGDSSWRHRLSRSAAGLRADVSFAVVDFLLVVFSYSFASAIRFADPAVTRVDEYWFALFRFLPLVALVHIVANFVVGAYGHVWEFASIGEARQVITANTIAAGVIVGAALTWDLLNTQLNPVPVSVWIVGATFTIITMGAVRFRSRLFSFNRLSARGGLPRVLVVGADSTAARFAREAMDGSAADIVGFVSHDGAPEARQIAGRPVFGGPLLIRDLVRDRRIEQLVIVAPSDALVRSIVDMSLDNRVRLSVLPSFSDTLLDRHGIRDPRDLQVEDMLPRAQVDTDVDSVRDSIDGRRVLITGAGGSIGSEILRQVLRFEPALVVALDHDETHLHDALVGIGGDDRIVMSLCDIRDKPRVDAIFETWRPDVVFHAAAHKHVPILQDNPDEAVKTNVLGSANVIDACHRFSADRFVLISTDKAVAPANVMGATKRFAEIVTQAAQHRQSGCVFTAVRFGNVLGSRGSVVPTFVNQIKNGGPVTITHPEMTRFFMTIGEAVQLVLQAGAIASGGEIHVLDMGQPVRILDLAHRMIRMAGLVPGEDIEIEIVGRRPGEKLTEELAIAPLESSTHPRIRIARPQLPGGPATVHTRIEALRYCVEQADILAMMDIVSDVVTAEGSEEVVDLTASIRIAEWS